MYSFSCFHQELDSGYAWFSEPEKQCLGAYLVDFGHESSLYLGVDFVGGCGYIEACHYVLQHFSSRYEQVSSLNQELVFYCCVLLSVHKKSAV